MMDALQRVLGGWPLTRRERHWAVIIIAAWFLMDLAQWIDWLIGKF